MKLSGIRELLLKKAEGNPNLHTLLRYSSEDMLEKHIIESLEKMAEDRRRPRSSNQAVMTFGTEDLDSSGSMANTIHDALSHHASQYKAALKEGKSTLAAEHMKKIHHIMQFSRKLVDDAGTDHSKGKLRVEAVDPKPWERSHYNKPNPPGSLKPYVTDTKGWSRSNGDYKYLQGPPHHSYSGEVESHGHNGAYPLEEMKVNGKYIHIDDNATTDGKFKPHIFDSHPIIHPKQKGWTPLFLKPIKEFTDDDIKDYIAARNEWNDHPDYLNHLDLQDTEEFKNRGKNKAAPVHKEIANKLQIGNPDQAQLPNATPDVKVAAPTAPQKPETNPLLERYLAGGGKMEHIDLLPDNLKAMLLKKSILDIKLSLLKNADFLVKNKDILDVVKARLEKAKIDDADAWLRENDPDYNPESYSDDVDEYDTDESNEDDEPDFLENPENIDDDDLDDEDKQLLEEERAKGPQYQDIEEDEPMVQEPSADTATQQPEEIDDVEETAEPEKKRSAYTDWKPRNYTPEEQAKIKKYLDDGYNDGDAEILAGLSQRFSNMESAVKHKVKPHQMSEKMHGMLKDLASKYLDDYKSKEYEQTMEEPEHSPVKATTAHAIKTHAEHTKDYHDAKSKFESSPEYAKLSTREKHAARKKWHEDYVKANPHYIDNALSSANKMNEIARANQAARQQKLESDKESIATAGEKAIGQEGGSASEGSMRYSRGMDYDENDPTSHQLTTQGAYQSAGGISDEDKGMIGTTTIQDPHYNFATKNPSLKDKYAKELQAKQQKLLSSMSPEQKQRLDTVKAIKGDK